ncbi:MAG: hypothetical protein WDW38_006882 [Sanguina aurantia]
MEDVTTDAVAQQEPVVESVAAAPEAVTEETAAEAATEAVPEAAEEDEQEMEAEDQHEGAADGSGEAPAVGGKRSAEEAADAGSPEAVKKVRRTTPLKLGYRTFHSCSQASEYFKKLLQTPALGTDFNEYEHLALLDLLKKGHPAPESKIGSGLRSFQVRRFSVDDPLAKALFAVRKDGSAVDFSYMKCLVSLYPGELEMGKRNAAPAPKAAGGRGGGRGGRGGGGGGGRAGGEAAGAGVGPVAAGRGLWGRRSRTSDKTVKR